MNFDRHTVVRGWILCGYPRGDRVHLNLGLMFTNAWPQPRDHSTRMRTTIIYEAFFSECSKHRQKQIVVPVGSTEEIEVGGKDADNSPARSIEIDRAANHRRIGIET